MISWCEQGIIHSWHLSWPHTTKKDIRQLQASAWCWPWMGAISKADEHRVSFSMGPIDNGLGQFCNLYLTRGLMGQIWRSFLKHRLRNRIKIQVWSLHAPWAGVPVVGVGILRVVDSEAGSHRTNVAHLLAFLNLLACSLDLVAYQWEAIWQVRETAVKMESSTTHISEVLPMGKAWPWAFVIGLRGELSWVSQAPASLIVCGLGGDYSKIKLRSKLEGIEAIGQKGLVISYPRLRWYLNSGLSDSWNPWSWFSVLEEGPPGVLAVSSEPWGWSGRTLRVGATGARWVIHCYDGELWLR